MLQGTRPALLSATAAATTHTSLGGRQNTWKLDSQQLLLEHGPDPLLLLAPDGSISYLNTAAEELFGYSRSQLLGTDPGLLLAGPSRADFHALLGGLAGPAPRAVQPLAGSGRRADGTEIPVDITCSLLPAGALAGTAAPSVALWVRGAGHRTELHRSELHRSDLHRSAPVARQPPGRRRQHSGRGRAPPSDAGCVDGRSRRLCRARRPGAGRGAARPADVAAQRHPVQRAPRRRAAPPGPGGRAAAEPG